MRVLVTGAYGLIGSACLARLHADGHEMVGCGRSVAAARRRFPYAQWIEADFSRIQDADGWRNLLANIDAVVNCVGVLQSGLGDDVRRIQLAGTIAMFDACARAGVKRVVHISALGAEADGPSSFSRTKAGAEAHLRTLTLDWVILRPGLVLGPAVYGGTAMLRAVAAFPGIVPVVAANAQLQVIGVDDLADTVARAVMPSAPAKVTWDVSHPTAHTLAKIVTAIRGWLGFRSRPVVPLPNAVGRVLAAIADAVGWLGWRSPVRTTSLAQLAAGVVGDPQPWMAATGIRPKSLHELLTVRPANVQDRWFAKLYLLKPLAVFVIIVATLMNAAVQFASAWRHAGAMPEDAPLGEIVARSLPFILTGGLALLFGVGLIFRATARLALLGLILLTLFQGANDILTAWHFGFFPHGVLAYTAPILLAMLFTLAILDDR
jgi:uncharacterized protein YbjT (DUF2867 family)